MIKTLVKASRSRALRLAERYGHFSSDVCDLNRFDKAEGLGVRVLKMREKVLGVEPIDTLLSVANLAVTYEALNRLSEAEELEVRLLDMYKKILGPEHSNALARMANLALTYFELDRFDEAEELECDHCKAVKRL